MLVRRGECVVLDPFTCELVNRIGGCTSIHETVHGWATGCTSIHETTTPRRRWVRDSGRPPGLLTVLPLGGGNCPSLCSARDDVEFRSFLKEWDSG